MKKSLFPIVFIILLAGTNSSLSAQVGIGTTTPQATLDIMGHPTDISQMDGVIPPRINGDQLRAKIYSSAQTGAMVYVSVADSAPSGQTVNVTLTGYYYFNGHIWIRMAPESEDWKIKGNSNTNASTNFLGTTNNQDLILKRNSVQSGWLATNTTAFGVNSINPLSNSGDHNTAFGQDALFKNTFGHRNTAIGSGALTHNTTGFQNTAMGRYTMHFNTTGSNNMAIGQEAAKWNSTGENNVAIGFNALRQNGTGSNNIAIGRSAMAALPSSGADAINNVGNNNIIIGAFTELPNNTASNQMVLGGTAGTTNATRKTIINGIVNPAAGAPVHSEAPGVVGEFRVVGNFFYVHCSDGKWRRASLETF